MSRATCLLCLVFGVLLTWSLAGCGQSNARPDPELVARLTLTEEPDGAMVVPEVREILLGESDDHAEHEHEHEHAAEHEDHPGQEHDEHAEHDELGDEDLDDDKDDDNGVEEDEDDEDEESDGDDDDDEHADHDEHAEHEHDDHELHEDGHGEHAHDDHEAHEHEHVVVVKATEPIDVVLVGQIGGLTNPWQETQPDFPFAKDQATFFLADPQSVTENEESGHAHAPGEECAFCAAHAADRSDMLAMVRFLDENANVLRTDVRQLFDVKEKDTVVVRGTARVIEGGMMVVDATGLYVRR